MAGRGKKPNFLLWSSGIFLLLGAVAIVSYGDFRHPEALIQFGWGVAIMSLGFICSWGLQSVSVWWFWAIAILTRLVLFPMYPGDDVWRYVWEGYIQTQGFNPYELSPSASELIPYRTSWWSQINHPNVSAIYPPLAQLGFQSLAAISANFLLFKAAFVLADLTICFLLSRQFTYLQTTLYAWNPLIIYSFAGGAHYDSWFILPLVAAGLLCDRQPTRSLHSQETAKINSAIDRETQLQNSQTTLSHPGNGMEAPSLSALASPLSGFPYRY